MKNEMHASSFGQLSKLMHTRLYEKLILDVLKQINIISYSQNSVGIPSCQAGREYLFRLFIIKLFTKPSLLNERVTYWLKAYKIKLHIF